MTAAEQTDLTVITEPGVYPDIPFADYLADPWPTGSLSHSGAKTLVTKTPAMFAYEREHGRPHTEAFDLGHAAHRIVLGDGVPVVVIPDDVTDKNGGWTTKDAKALVAEVRAAGQTPVKPETWDTVEAMAKAIRAHPLASKLLAPGVGTPEVSAFAEDEQTGVMMRCRYDYLAESDGRRLILRDYKTTDKADRDSFGKSAANYGYALQDAFYSAIAKRLGLARDVVFLFIAQEKTPPYLVNVLQLDHTALRIGEIQMRRALALYKRCTDTGEWPGYPPEVALTSLPIWFERQYEDDLAS